MPRFNASAGLLGLLVLVAFACQSPSRDLSGDNGGDAGAPAAGSGGSISGGAGHAGTSGAAGAISRAGNAGLAGSGDGGAGSGGEGGDGALASCEAPRHTCNGECLAADACCNDTDCPSGIACISNVCSCGAGKKACGDSCIASNACCSAQDCPTGGSCVDGSCACPSGTHECNAACVTDDSVDHCGVACDACSKPTGGDVTCNVTCMASCPTGQKACAGTCIANNAACTGTCPGGSHDCSGLCAPDDSTTLCGSDCKACTVPANSDATCNGACSFTCKANYKLCNGACIANSACCQASDCASPPATTCVGSSLRSYASTGTCTNNSCSYAPTDKQCSAGCSGNACVVITPTQIAFGFSHTCVLMSNQHVYCFGGNKFYPDGSDLGNGSIGTSLTPVEVSGITTATQIAANGDSTCALLADKTVKCWGTDDYGQVW